MAGHRVDEQRAAQRGHARRRRRVAAPSASRPAPRRRPRSSRSSAGASAALGGQQAAQPLTPAQVGEPGDRPARLDPLVGGRSGPTAARRGGTCRSATATGRRSPRRPCAACGRAAWAAPSGTSVGYQAPAQTSQRPQSAARRVVERLLQEAHAARVGPTGSRASTRPRRRGPRPPARSAPRRRPTARPVASQPPETRCTAPSTSSTLSSSSSRVRRTSATVSSAAVDMRLRGRRPARRARRSASASPRHRRGREVVPDLAVLGRGQQQHVGALGGATGPADLLVVGDRRRGRAEVHHEAEVGLVEAHAQRARRDQRLDLVVAQGPLELEPVGRVGAPGVGAHVVPGVAQQRGGVLGGGDRQRVDDAAARQLAEVRRAASRAAPRASAAAARRAAGSSRASEPRTVRTSAPPAPSCSTTSSTTRWLAVAVVASTGRPAGSRASRSRMRR